MPGRWPPAIAQGRPIVPLRRPIGAKIILRSRTLPAASRPPPAASRQPPAASRQPPAARRQPPAASRQPPPVIECLPDRRRSRAPARLPAFIRKENHAFPHPPPRPDHPALQLRDSARAPLRRLPPPFAGMVSRLE